MPSPIALPESLETRCRPGTHFFTGSLAVFYNIDDGQVCQDACPQNVIFATAFWSAVVSKASHRFLFLLRVNFRTKAATGQGSQRHSRTFPRTFESSVKGFTMSPVHVSPLPVSFIYPRQHPTVFAALIPHCLPRSRMKSHNRCHSLWC